MKNKKSARKTVRTQEKRSDKPVGNVVRQKTVDVLRAMTPQHNGLKHAVRQWGEAGVAALHDMKNGMELAWMDVRNAMDMALTRFR